MFKKFYNWRLRRIIDKQVKNTKSDNISFYNKDDKLTLNIHRFGESHSVSQHFYDDNGNIVKLYYYNFNRLNTILLYEYYDNGNLKKLTARNFKYDTGKRVETRDVTEYDTDGCPVCMYSYENGQEQRFDYENKIRKDENGRITHKYINQTSVIEDHHFVYDSDGRITSHVDVKKMNNGLGTFVFTESYTYDEDGREATYTNYCKSDCGETVDHNCYGYDDKSRYIFVKHTFNSFDSFSNSEYKTRTLYWDDTNEKVELTINGNTWPHLDYIQYTKIIRNEDGSRKEYKYDAMYSNFTRGMFKNLQKKFSFQGFTKRAKFTIFTYVKTKHLRVFQQIERFGEREFRV